MPEITWFPNVRLASLFNHVFYICVLWGIVNLLPIYPLDGGQVIREVLLKFNARDGMRQSLLLSILAAGAMAAIGLLQWQDWFVAIFFGYLAYASYAALEAYGGRNRW